MNLRSTLAVADRVVIGLAVLALVAALTYAFAQPLDLHLGCHAGGSAPKPGGRPHPLCAWRELKHVGREFRT